MSRIRVLDLAKELNLKSKDALAKLQEIGIQASTHFNMLDEQEAEKLRIYAKTGRSPDKDASKNSGKVIIRRRPTEPAAEAPSSLAPVSDASAFIKENVRDQQVVETSQLTAARAGSAEPKTLPTGLDMLAIPTTDVRAQQQYSASALDSAEKLSSANKILVESQHKISKTSGAELSNELASSSKNNSAIHANVSSDAQMQKVFKETPSESPKTSTTSATQDKSSVQPEQTQVSAPLPASSSGATVLKRPTTPSALPAGSATIVSRQPAQPSTPAGGATILRREGAALQASGPAPYISSGYNSNSSGGFRGGSQGQGGYSGNSGGFGNRPQGGFGNRPSGGYQGSGDSAGSNTGSREGGYTGRDSSGNFRGNQSGGYQGSSGQQGSGGYPGRPQQGGFGGQGSRFGGGQSSGGASSDRPGFRSPSMGGAPREGFSGGPRGVGAPMGGGMRGPQGSGFGAPQSPLSSTSTTENVLSKEGGTRSREREKEVEQRKRRIAEEEEGRRTGKLKGRTDGTGLASDIELEEEYESQGDSESVVPKLRTVIPNRRRGSAPMARRHKKAEPANPTKQSKMIVGIDESMSVSDMASAMSVKSSAVIKTLMGFGMMASVNQLLDFDTATLVAQEFGFETQNKAVSITDILNTKKTDAHDVSTSENITRPPVITIMGHVDHGKTSLLDSIRSSDVAKGEAGGITQAIGAYQVEHEGRKITFLDTPGHEAFTAMRARGAQITDVVVLVVAADDGVMPQTMEAIAHAKAAKVPIIVAVNKIDKPGANLDKIQRELSAQGVQSEEWGGDTMFVPVSAKTKEGIPQLLESILLQADVLDLKSPIDGLSNGSVIESRLDKSRGPVATLVVTHGTLKQGDWIVAGKTYGRVRAMFSDKGDKITEALPSSPVEILGLSETPSAGDTFNCVVNDAIAKEAVAYRIEKRRQKELANAQKATMESMLARMSEESSKQKELPLIIKADTHGSVEAILVSLKKLDVEKVKTRVIHSAVGGVTETDASLAIASQALVIGFNVRPDKQAIAFAERQGVTISMFSIIYELLDFVKLAMAGQLEPIRSEKILGHAEVRSTFNVPKIGVIAGTGITDGKFVRNAHVRVVREGAVIYTGRVSSLKRFKEDAKEVLQGFECGIGIENYNDLKISDVLEAFVIEETAASLN
jgi:translation initiation factor IF-2